MKCDESTLGGHSGRPVSLLERATREVLSTGHVHDAREARSVALAVIEATFDTIAERVLARIE